MVGVTGFEPATPASRTQCSSQAELHPVQCSADVRLGGVTQALPKEKLAPGPATNGCAPRCDWPFQVAASPGVATSSWWYAPCDAPLPCGARRGARRRLR